MVPKYSQIRTIKNTNTVIKYTKLSEFGLDKKAPFLGHWFAKQKLKVNLGFANE